MWLGNSRGNCYSRTHTKVDPNGSAIDRKQYWSFSFHEMGQIDIPSSLDYITKRTQQQRMHYIGHSQGTSAFFAMTSERPEYNDKIISMNALAPIAFMGHMPSPILQAVVTIVSNITVS